MKTIFVLLSMILILLLSNSNVLAIDVTMSASRNACVAPCAVIFNADLSASVGTLSPDHQNAYIWDFDDPGAGDWVTGESKETDTGVVSVHVFETAGTYNVSLTVNEDAPITSGLQVVVTDGFLTSNTTCVNESGDSNFTGCPTGASNVSIDDLSGIGTSYVDAGERLLFKRGSTWSVTSNLSWVTNSGPVHIGAYGTGNRPQITMSGTADRFIKTNEKGDWRITDLHLTGSVDNYNGSGQAIIGDNTIDHLLIQNNEIDSWNYGLSYTAENRTGDTEAEKRKYIFLIENVIAPGRTLGAFINSEYLSVCGNTMGGGGQHTLRIPHAYVGTVSHNLMSGAGYNLGGATDYGGHVLKMHSPDEAGNPGGLGTFAETGANGIATPTKYVVVSYNVFGGAGDYQVAIAPQSLGADHIENLTDIYINYNRFLAEYGNQNRDVQVGLSGNGRFYSIKNNIFDGSGGILGYKGIDLLRNTYGNDSGVHYVYNNTVYRSDNVSSTSYGIEVSQYVDTCSVINSYVSFPSVTGTKGAANNLGESTVLTNNVYTDSNDFVDPDNVDPLLRDFTRAGATTHKWLSIGGATLSLPDGSILGIPQ